MSSGSVDPKEKDYVNVGSWTGGKTLDQHCPKNRAQCLAQSRHPHNDVD